MCLFFIVQREAGSTSGATRRQGTGEIDVTITMGNHSDLMSRTSWVEDWAQRGYGEAVTLVSYPSRDG